MALDFPNSASTGTHYTGTNGIVYIYDGVKWNGQYTGAELNTGKVRYYDNQIQSLITNQDIVVTTTGTEGSFSVPSLKIPVGTIIQSNTPIVAAIADLTLVNVIDYSTTSSDVLNIGDYGVTNGVPAPWAIYQFTTSTTFIQIDDVIAGPGIPALPNPSVVLAVSTGTWSNIVVAYSDFSVYSTTTSLPLPGITVTVARFTVNASLSINTDPLTDIALSVGVGGHVVAHGDVIPYETNAYDLGSPSKRFRKLWLGAGTIYVLDETLGTDQAIGARDGNLYIAGGAGLQVGEFTLHDNTIQIANNSRDIIVGQTTATGAVIFNRPIEVNTTASINAFKVDRTGRTQLRVPIIPAGDVGAFSIIGNQDGLYQPVVNSGGMLHITGNNGSVSRITNDAYGTGSFPAYISRAARGTAAAPSTVQSGDIMSRYSTVGWGTTGFPTGPAATNIEVYARENFTDSAQGTEYRFYTASTGTTTKSLSMTINDSGISFVNTLNTGTGITFRDSTRQTTAYTGTVAVSNITGNLVNEIYVGVGLTATGYTGVIGIDATGVQNVYGTVNQITVTNDGSKNLTLTTPQNLNTTATVTFQNITVTGNLNVVGTSTIVQNSVVQGKILYLANTATLASQIDGGGIIIGTSTFARSILYNLVNNRWDTDGAGLLTLHLDASTATIIDLYASGNAHIGSAYQNYDFPNADLQIDANTNNYTQIVIQNHNSGTQASTDIVATNDLGDDTNHFIDMGINSSNYVGGYWTVNGANDGYLYINGGNLAVGTQATNTNIVFFTDGTTASNIRAVITATGLTVNGSVTATKYNKVTITQPASSATLTISDGKTIAFPQSLSFPNSAGTSSFVLSTNGAGTLAWVSPNSGPQGPQGVAGPQGPQGPSGVDGVTGPQGPQGVTGPQGPSGVNGVTGPQGPQGATGPQGPWGATGVTGPQGPQGVTGPQGPQGVAGPQGPQGVAGPQGPQGVAGPQGPQGVVGVTGPQGPQGVVGPQGPQGPQGITGPQGPQGITGPQGPTGLTGPQGPQGITGPQGPQGVTGPQGVAGPQGPQGVTGPQGPSGPAGNDGTSVTIKGSVASATTSNFAAADPSPIAGDGYIVNDSGHLWVYTSAPTYYGFSDVGTIVGPKGPQGPQGVAGPQGVQGPQGVTGPQGPQGVTGPQGPQGVTGPQGPQGVTGPQGPQGVTGPQGPWGATGVTGPQGPQGVTGPQGPQGVTGPQGPTGPSGITTLLGGNNIVITTSTTSITVSRIDGLQTVVTGSSTATYTMLSTDQYFGTIRSNTGTCAVTLPLGSSVTAGRQFVVKDEGGHSGSASKRITVYANGSDTIDGAASRAITSNYGALTLIWTGTRWSVI